MTGEVHRRKETPRTRIHSPSGPRSLSAALWSAAVPS